MYRARRAGVTPPGAGLHELAKVSPTTVVAAGTRAVRRHPLVFTGYVVGILTALFAGGISVAEDARVLYEEKMAGVQYQVSGELRQAAHELKIAEDRFYNAKGWFWQCDEVCTKHKKKRDIVAASVAEIEARRDLALTDARQTVGLWSTYGVGEAREGFSRAYSNGLEQAKRMTMYDAIMVAVTRNRDETLVSTLLRLVMQYVVNLLIALVFSLFHFAYILYTIASQYGAGFVQVTGFVLLGVLAATSALATVLGGVAGMALGGGVVLAKMEVARLEDSRNRPGKKLQ